LLAALASAWLAHRTFAQSGANRPGDVNPPPSPAIERQPLGPSRAPSPQRTAADEQGDAGDSQGFTFTGGTTSPQAPAPPSAPKAAQPPGVQEQTPARGDAAQAERAGSSNDATADASDRLERMAQRLAADESENAEASAGSAGKIGAAPAADEDSSPATVDSDNDTAKPSADSSVAAAAALEQQPIGPRTDNSGATLETKTPPRETGNWVINTLGALGLVIGLVFMLRWGLMRWSGRGAASGASSVVEVLARVPVAARSHVLLLRMGGRILVVGDGAGGMRTLAQVDEPEEVADLLAAVSASRPNSVTQTFRQLFDRFNGDYREEGDAADEGADRHEFHVDRTRDGLSGLIGRVRAVGRKGGGG
jgi:flagellar biogenesis protein FliO